MRPCGARINYIVQGTGPIAVLALAPGGMRSSIGMWSNQPYDPLTKLGGSSSFRVIAMDQRCAGASDGPLAQSWETYRDDQLAVLDHAGVDKGCLLLGSCIGPSFIFSLLLHSPHRFNAAVLLQPIGIGKHTTEPGHAWPGLNTQASQHWFGDWAAQMEASGRATKPALVELFANMFVRAPQFIFTASREDVALVSHPLLVYAGKDMFHPSETAREIAKLAPNAEYVEKWRDQDYNVAGVDERIEAFFKWHASTGLPG